MINIMIINIMIINIIPFLLMIITIMIRGRKYEREQAGQQRTVGLREFNINSKASLASLEVSKE